jgi:hypothetical protein
VNPNVLAAIRKRVEGRAPGTSLTAIVDETRAFFKIAGVAPDTTSKILSMARPMARIRCLDAGVDDVPPGEAKIGGWPALPRGAPWPTAVLPPSARRGRGRKDAAPVPFDFVAQFPVDSVPDDVVTALHLSGARERMLSFFMHLDFEPREGDSPFVHIAALVRIDPLIGLDVVERRGAKLLLAERPAQLSLDLSLPPETAQARASLDSAHSAIFEEADVISNVIGAIERAWDAPRHQIGGWSSETLDGDNTALEPTPLLQLDDAALDLGIAGLDGANEGFIRFFCRPPPRADGVIPALASTSRVQME